MSTPANHVTSYNHEKLRSNHCHQNCQYIISVQCFKCEKMFSPAYSSQIIPSTTITGTTAAITTSALEGRNPNSTSSDHTSTSSAGGGGENYHRDISSAEQRRQLQLCVFCRLQDPSRTLEQVRDHFLQR